MDEIEDFLENLNIKKYLFNIIIIILFCLLSYFVIYRLNNINKKIDNKVVLNKQEKEENKNDSVEYVIVDIKGEVTTPGVYELIKGSRVIDVINEAQGLTSKANTRYINLSKILEDGDAIVIYSNDEIENASKEEKIEVTTPCVCEDVNSACIENNTNKETSQTNGKININTATQEELTSLSGIGEAKAKSIIKYREENGNFKSIEDIMKVSGISENLFAKIKENITV
mgnify:CR=1 FL=1